ncbi:MAG: PAS domain S-box protein, partial [Spirochaetota bacterium]|nr:PAS domain S-box protein [Spirochaetota bacterium]
MGLNEFIKSKLVNKTDLSVIFVPVFFILLIIMLLWHTAESFNHQKKEYLISDLLHRQESLIQLTIKQLFIYNTPSQHAQVQARQSLLNNSKIMISGGTLYSPLDNASSIYLEVVKDKQLQDKFKSLDHDIRDWFTSIDKLPAPSDNNADFPAKKDLIISQGDSLIAEIKLIKDIFTAHVKKEMSESLALYIKIIILGFVVGIFSSYKIIKIKKDLRDEEIRHEITSGQLMRYEKDLDFMVESKTDRLMKVLARTSEISLVKSEIEKEVRADEKRYKQLIDFSPLGILVIFNGVISYANTLAIDILALSHVEEALGKRITDLVLPNYQKQIEDILDKVLHKQEELYWHEEHFVRLDGTVIYIDLMASPLSDTNNLGAQLVMRNVTSRKKNTDDLIRLATAVEQAAESIVITSPDSEIVYVNPAFLKSTGYQKEEVLG